MLTFPSLVVPTLCPTNISDWLPLYWDSVRLLVILHSDWLEILLLMVLALKRAFNSVDNISKNLLIIIQYTIYIPYIQALFNKYSIHPDLGSVIDKKQHSAMHQLND